MSTLSPFTILISIACENIRFSSLFVAERPQRRIEEQGETDVFAGYDKHDNTET